VSLGADVGKLVGRATHIVDCREGEGRKKVAAFWKKRRKNFFDFRPEAFERHGPKVAKFFCFFL
jgi:hypothetical protein